MKESELTYYAVPGAITDLAACPQHILARMPEDPTGIMGVVRGCVVSAGMLRKMGLPVPDGREHEAQVRPVREVVARIEELQPDPLVVQRPPEQRFLGTCRNFATLACALLRHVGIPSRVRAGFAGYFEPGLTVDHWVVEYHRDGRWVRDDPQLDADWLRRRGVTMTSEELAANLYWSGSEAWRRCRTGDADPDRFDMGGNRGIGEVRGSVMLDLAALNKVEVLPWDAWGQMEASYEGRTGAGYDELLDDIAATTLDGDVDAIRKIYAGDLQVPEVLVAC